MEKVKGNGVTRPRPSAIPKQVSFCFLGFFWIYNTILITLVPGVQFSETFGNIHSPTPNVCCSVVYNRPIDQRDCLLPSMSFIYKDFDLHHSKDGTLSPAQIYPLPCFAACLPPPPLAWHLHRAETSVCFVQHRECSPAGSEWSNAFVE